MKRAVLLCLALAACSDPQSPGSDQASEARAPASDTAGPAEGQSPDPSPSASPGPSPSAPATPSPSPTASPAPVGTLPLARGVYVAAGSDCRTAANAGIRVWNGTGLSGSSTRACRATVLSRSGPTYKVDQSCEDTYDGKRRSEAQTITVGASGGFTLTTASGSQTFRLCPRGEAPPDFQRIADQ